MTPKELRARLAATWWTTVDRRTGGADLFGGPLADVVLNLSLRRAVPESSALLGEEPAMPPSGPEITGDV